MSAKVATVPRVAWSPPAPRRVRALRDRLRLVYGRPVAPPHGKGLEELILTVLSQSTNDRNRDVAYVRLRARFPAWEEVRDATITLLGGVTFADLAKRAGGPWVDPGLLALSGAPPAG